MSLVRAFLAIANKYQFKLKQLDIETAFLYDNSEQEIYVEIPEGVTVNSEIRRNYLGKLEKSLYGQKISQKNEMIGSLKLNLTFYHMRLTHVYLPKKIKTV